VDVEVLTIYPHEHSLDREIWAYAEIRQRPDMAEAIQQRLAKLRR